MPVRGDCHVVQAEENEREGQGDTLFLMRGIETRVQNAQNLV